MEEILNIIIKIVGMALGLALGYILKLFVNWLKNNVTKQDLDELEEFIAIFVEAAEQMFKYDDIDGSKRLDYVQNMLIEQGYELSDEIRAMIESYVLRINMTNQK